MHIVGHKFAIYTRTNELESVCYAVEILIGSKFIKHQLSSPKKYATLYSLHYSLLYFLTICVCNLYIANLLVLNMQHMYLSRVVCCLRLHTLVHSCIGVDAQC